MGGRASKNRTFLPDAGFIGNWVEFQFPFYPLSPEADTFSRLSVWIRVCGCVYVCEYTEVNNGCTGGNPITIGGVIVTCD